MIVFLANQNILINSHIEKQNKIKKVCRSTWKISKNRGILKYIWPKVIREKLMFRMLWNTLKDGLCCLRNESVSTVSLLNTQEATDFIWSGQGTSFNLLCILIFFYKIYWPYLTSSSKCRGSLSHGDIKFWFSGNAKRGRHCLLLQFHQIYKIRCIMSFKKIADTSFKLVCLEST